MKISPPLNVKTSQKSTKTALVECSMLITFMPEVMYVIYQALLSSAAV